MTAVLAPLGPGLGFAARDQGRLVPCQQRCTIPMQVPIKSADALDGGSLGSHGIVSFGPFRLFAVERQLKKGDEPLQLGGRALDALIALVNRAGEVVTQKELIARVWPDVTVEEANLRIHIANLWNALGPGARTIVTS